MNDIRKTFTREQVIDLLEDDIELSFRKLKPEQVGLLLEYVLTAVADDYQHLEHKYDWNIDQRAAVTDFLVEACRWIFREATADYPPYADLAKLAQGELVSVQPKRA